MAEQPRDWDKELANIDRAIAKQPGPPAGSAAPVVQPGPRRRFIALAWLWTVLGVVLGIALLLWPYEKNCGIRLILDRKSTRLNSSHVESSYAVFCLKKKK